jgi:ATP-dependent RNA helicase DDX27
MLIFDEADRLLEMGLEKEIQEIIKETPKERQTVLFSATMTSGIHRLTSLEKKKPVRIHVDFDEHTATGLK